MKRYLLFLFDDYYPQGGWGDFQGDFDSVEAALLAEADMSPSRFDTRQVVDTESKKVVYGYDQGEEIRPT